MSGGEAAQEALTKRRRREIVLWVLPIVIGAIAFVVAYVVASDRPERFEHVTTLVAANDGRVSVRDNRDLANELIRARVRTTTFSPDVTVELDPRFGSVLDVIVRAGSQADATALADGLAAQAVEARWLASIERFSSAIDAHEAAIVDLDRRIAELDQRLAVAPADSPEAERLRRELAALTDQRIAAQREAEAAQIDIDTAVMPVTVNSSIPQGRVAPTPTRTAGLAGAAAAMVALVVAAAASSFDPRRDRRTD